MLCANCGTSNRDDEKFCRGCLQPISAVWQSPKSELLSAAAVENGDYAGFWRRFAAVILDGLVLAVATIPIGIVFALAGASVGPDNAVMAALLPLSYLLMLVGPVLYYVLMESGERGATYGKRILKMRVVDVHGERIGVLRAFLRYVAHFVSYVTIYIGFLIQPFTERKQALHDMISGTVVVRTEDERGSGGIVVVVIALFLFVVLGVGILAAVAIPAYQDYVTKAKMSQVMQMGNSAYKAVESFYAQAGRYPASLSETQAAPAKPPFVSEIEVNPSNGEVRILFNGAMSGALAGKSVYFTPTRYVDGSFTWKCSSTEIIPRLLPRECR